MGGRVSGKSRERQRGAPVPALWTPAWVGGLAGHPRVAPRGCVACAGGAPPPVRLGPALPCWRAPRQAAWRASRDLVWKVIITASTLAAVFAARVRLKEIIIIIM